MSAIDKALRFLIQAAIPKIYRKRLILSLMSTFDMNPLNFAYNQLGVLKFGDLNVSGEAFVIKDILPKLLYPDDEKLVFFDVGANSGEYSNFLLKNHPNSYIYSFEPNPNSFIKLKKNTDSNHIKPFNIGLGKAACDSIMFTYTEDVASQHASLYESVFTDIYKNDKLSNFPVKLMRLDDFCKEHNISNIDFLKIDTEGYELQGLHGAGKLIDNRAIKIIQFEFNEMNVVSRVFFKDFYELLGGRYNIYRLDTNRLIPIPKYNTIYEIFKFQNFLAIQKKIDFYSDR